MSGALAPVLLIGGWSVAAALQPPGYDPVRDTISALAGHAATDRWVMTAALALLGACHIVTAAGLRAASRASRIVHAVAGVATILVAAFPLPATGTSSVHGLVAGVSLIGLAVWPAFSGLPGSRTAAAVLVALLVWFGVQLYGDGGWIGLTERLVAGAEALYPLVAVAGSFRRRS